MGEPPFFLGTSVFFALKEACYAARKDAGELGQSKVALGVLCIVCMVVGWLGGWQCKALVDVRCSELLWPAACTGIPAPRSRFRAG